jgi:hypothetical protein
MNRQGDCVICSQCGRKQLQDDESFSHCDSCMISVCTECIPTTIDEKSQGEKRQVAKMDAINFDMNLDSKFVVKDSSANAGKER